MQYPLSRTRFAESGSADYARFSNARGLGYTPVGLGFGQIHSTWEDTTEVMLRILRTGRHLLPPAPL